MDKRGSKCEEGKQAVRKDGSSDYSGSGRSGETWLEKGSMLRKT